MNSNVDRVPCGIDGEVGKALFFNTGTSLEIKNTTLYLGRDESGKAWGLEIEAISCTSLSNRCACTSYTDNI